MKFLTIFAILVSIALTQQQQRQPYKPTPEELEQIRAKTAELDALIAPLRLKYAGSARLADVEVFEKAARWIVEFPEEFFTQDYVAQTLAVLDQGAERARQLAGGKTPWLAEKGRTLRGYWSEVDGSVQPYGLVVPESYDGNKPVRLDVSLHGRLGRLNEVNLLAKYTDAKTGWPSVSDDGQICLDVFGRMNNAFHWGGETDVFEAIRDVQQRYRIDAKRIVLKGFSMGSAGSWHLGMHFPSFWASLESGSGSSRSRRAGNPSTVPEYQRPMLTIFDNIVDWSINLFNLPTAGYGGENDPQRRATVMVQEQLVKEGFHMEGEPFNLTTLEIPAIFVTGPATGHTVHPESRKIMDAFHKKWADAGVQSPDRIRFRTFTMRYNQSHWATIEGLEKHYERAELDAKRSDDRQQYDIATTNIARLTLRETDRARTIAIDGQTVRVKPAAQISLVKSGGNWRAATSRDDAGLHKKHGLQGPIDDAFLEPFLCVRPTGTPWNAAVNEEALKELEHFDRVHAKYMRGHVRVKDDKDVTDSDIRMYHLILFGDPGSNRLIARLNGKLPLGWTRDSIKMDDRTFTAADHVPLMIYPNPLSPSRYVVLNSGLTVQDREYPASDYLTPLYGDFALLKTGTDGPPQVEVAGLFDETWRLPATLSAPATASVAQK
ncbi:MAG TPA: hypothetical protein VGF59_34540 [Bryobacteraceae bacterium]